VSGQTTQFVARYWVDILLLAGLVIIACAFTVCHIIDRARKNRSTGGKPGGSIDFEKPPFEVDYGPGEDCNCRQSADRP